jgi:hypothetical protein
MTKHRHAEFFHDVADGKGGNWEVHHDALGWLPATLYLEELYSDPTCRAIRRKPQTSQDRFEEVWKLNGVRDSLAYNRAFFAWKEAERQARKNSDD